MHEQLKPHTEELTDHNYEEVLERSYTDIPNKAFKSNDNVEEVLDMDFITASSNFWLKYEGGKYYQIYNEGIMSGTFNNRQPTFRAVYETMMEAFKNIIRIECEKEDKTSEDFIQYISMLNLSFDLLASKIESNLDDNISGDLIMSYLHAVFNSFINTNIK